MDWLIHLSVYRWLAFIWRLVIWSRTSSKRSTGRYSNSRGTWNSCKSSTQFERFNFGLLQLVCPSFILLNVSSNRAQVLVQEQYQQNRRRRIQWLEQAAAAVSRLQQIGRLVAQLTQRHQAAKTRVAVSLAIPTMYSMLRVHLPPLHCLFFSSSFRRRDLSHNDLMLRNHSFSLGTNLRELYVQSQSLCTSIFFVHINSVTCCVCVLLPPRRMIEHNFVETIEEKTLRNLSSLTYL